MLAECTMVITKPDDSESKEQFPLPDLKGGWQTTLWLNLHHQLLWNTDYKSNYETNSINGDYVLMLIK